MTLPLRGGSGGADQVRVASPATALRRPCHLVALLYYDVVVIGGAGGVLLAEVGRVVGLFGVLLVLRNGADE